MSTPSVELLRVQAERLRAFLANAGIDLKHKNALEAVAKMHGHKDWNSISNTQAMPSAAAYVSCIRYPSITDIAYSPDRDTALRDFICAARMLIDIMPGPAEDFAIHGQDIDAGLPCLSLEFRDVPLLTLQPVKVAELIKFTANKVVAARSDLPGVDESESFHSIGVALTSAFRSRPISDAEHRLAKVANSSAAHFLLGEFEDAVRQLSKRTQEEDNPPEITTSASDLLSAIDKVHVGHAILAVVR